MPRRGGEGALPLDRCRNCGRRVSEDDEKRIAGGAGVYPVVSRRGVTDESVVTIEDIGEDLWPDLRDQLRGALDVREEKRHGPERQVGPRLVHVG